MQSLKHLESTYKLDTLDKLDLQACVKQYQISKNENLLKIILYKLRPTFNYYLYIKTKHSDKSELLAMYEDKLLNCLESYDPLKNVKFITFYSRCLDNALINFLKANNTDYCLSLDYEYSDEDHTKIQISVEEKEFNRVEEQEVLVKLKSTLDKREYQVCELILTNETKMTYADIAKELGMSVSAIPCILKRLKHKFASGVYSEKLIKI